VIVSGIAGWLAFGPSITGSGQDAGKRYVEAVIGRPARVNPFFAHLDDADRDLSALIFSGLTRLGPNGEVVPDLAQSWDTSEDGKTVTFHLRPGIVWHTGSPFTSSDVVFTYSLLGDPAVQSDPDQASLWRQVKCTNPDPLTAVCQLPAPFAPFLAYTTIGILPQQILQGVNPASLSDNPFNLNPVGTGPFRLAELDATHAILKANTAYHLGAPKLDQIEMRFFPDAASAVNAVLAHNADGILIDPGADPSQTEALKSADDVKAYKANRTAYTIMYLNNGAPPLNEKPVRQAIAEAVDIDSIISDVLSSEAIPATSPILPGTWAYDPKVPLYKHSADDARHLLDQAGWKLPDNGHVRQRDKLELRLTLLTDQDPIRGAIADRIANELSDVGFAMNVTRKDPTSLVRDSLVPHDYQSAIFGGDTGPDPDPYAAWHSSQATDNGRNIAAYKSQEADSLMEKARRTSDLQERQKLYYSFQKVFHDDVPSLLLYYPVQTYYVRTNIKGIELGTLFNTGSRFRNAQDWRLETAVDIGQQ